MSLLKGVHKLKKIANKQGKKCLNGTLYTHCICCTVYVVFCDISNDIYVKVNLKFHFFLNIEIRTLFCHNYA
jgi:hypothetical protein